MQERLTPAGGFSSDAGPDYATPERSMVFDPGTARAVKEFLEAFAQQYTKQGYLSFVLGYLRDLSGCRCVGIRVLTEAGHIPYEAYTGFSREFWESENWLSVKCDNCACIRVIAGTPEPQDRPAMTPYGSFFTNHTANFVAGLSEMEKTRFRGKCVEHGLLSLLVTPIILEGRGFGAIHLADEQAGLITPELREKVESLAPLIGEAIRKFRFQSEMQRNRERLDVLGQIAAGMAHEIRNPLTSVKGFAQLLQGMAPAEGESLNDFLYLITEEVDRADEIIKKFLRVARPNAMNLVRQSLPPVVLAAVDSFSALARESKVTVSIEWEPDLPPCRIDREQMQEVIQLMGRNAIEAMPAGGELSIEGVYVPAEMSVVLEIQDTGRGIRPDEQEQIGTPFFTTKEVGAGLGLNLSLCYAVVRDHGGWIEVNSREGEGTVFRIYLPCN